MKSTFLFEKWLLWKLDIQNSVQLINNTLISDIYPGSSTHSKVVFREVLHPIELEFGNVDFWGEGKTGEPGEKPLVAE